MPNYLIIKPSIYIGSVNMSLGILLDSAPDSTECISFWESPDAKTDKQAIFMLIFGIIFLILEIYFLIRTFTIFNTKSQLLNIYILGFFILLHVTFIFRTINFLILGIWADKDCLRYRVASFFGMTPSIFQGEAYLFFALIIIYTLHKLDSSRRYLYKMLTLIIYALLIIHFISEWIVFIVAFSDNTSESMPLYLYLLFMSMNFLVFLIILPLGIEFIRVLKNLWPSQYRRIHRRAKIALLLGMGCVILREIITIILISTKGLSNTKEESNKNDSLLYVFILVVMFTAVEALPLLAFSYFLFIGREQIDKHRSKSLLSPKRSSPTKELSRSDRRSGRSEGSVGVLEDEGYGYRGMVVTSQPLGEYCESSSDDDEDSFSPVGY